MAHPLLATALLAKYEIVPAERTAVLGKRSQGCKRKQRDLEPGAEVDAPISGPTPKRPRRSMMVIQAGSDDDE